MKQQTVIRQISSSDGGLAQNEILIHLHAISSSSEFNYTYDGYGKLQITDEESASIVVFVLGKILPLLKIIIIDQR
jgi:hypothetical protein